MSQVARVDRFPVALGFSLAVHGLAGSAFLGGDNPASLERGQNSAAPLPAARVLQVSFTKEVQPSENKKLSGSTVLAVRAAHSAASPRLEENISVFVKQEPARKIHLAAADPPPSRLSTDEHMEFILTHGSAQEVERITRYVSCPTRNAFY